MAFRYRIVKKSIGNTPYTTRPDMGAPLTESELIAEVEAATSITKGDLQNTFSTVRRILIETARSGRGSETLFDFFRISLASGGSIEDPEETITKEEIDPRIVIYMAATAQREFSNNLSIKRTGIAGDRLPQIDVVRNMATANLDTYTPGNVLRVTGEDLKIVIEESVQGLFLSPEGGGPETRVEQYIDNSRGTLTVLLPGNISGPQRLLVRVKFSENLRETIYPTILTQE